MSVRRRSARPSSSPRLQARVIRERAAVVSALLALPYLTAAEAAYVAQTSASTIRRACDHDAGGVLRHTRVNAGKLIRIAPEDLRAWLRAGNGLAQAS